MLCIVVGVNLIWLQSTTILETFVIFPTYASMTKVLSKNWNIQQGSTQVLGWRQGMIYLQKENHVGHHQKIFQHNMNLQPSPWFWILFPCIPPYIYFGFSLTIFSISLGNFKGCWTLNDYKTQPLLHWEGRYQPNCGY